MGVRTQSPFPERPFLLALAGLVLVSSYYRRVLTFDDPWFGEQMYFLATEGIVRSELKRGFLNWQEQLFVFHKLHIYLGAGLVWLLGFSVYTVKSVSFLYFVFFALVCKQLGEALWAKSPSPLYLVAFGILLSPPLIEFSFASRPEILVATLGLLSFSCLFKNRSPLGNCMGGLAAGLSAFAHLNGLVYVGAGLVFIAYRDIQGGGLRKAISGILLFGLSSGLALSLYFLDVLSPDHWQSFLVQFTREPAIKRGLVAKVDALLGIPMLLTHTLFHAGLSLSALGVLLVVGRRLWEGRRQRGGANGPRTQLEGTRHLESLLDLGVYTLAMILVYTVLVNRSSVVYYLLFLPFFLFLVVLFLDSSLLKPGVRKTCLRLFVGFLFGSGVFSSTQLFNRSWASPSVTDDQTFLNSFLTNPSSPILAPNTFIFGEIGGRRILGLNRFLMPKADGGVFTFDDVLAECRQESLQYLIFEKRKDFAYYWPEAELSDRGRECFEYRYRGERFRILENLCYPGDG